MDEIARDLPGDDAAPPRRAGHGKGPEELLAYERGHAGAEAFAAPRIGARMTRADEPGRRPPPGDADGGNADAGDGDAAGAGAGGTDADADVIHAADAAAAVLAEGDTLEVEDEPEPDDELPPVPELADAAAIEQIVFVLLLSQKEGLSLLRLAQACNTTQKLVEEALALLQRDLERLGWPAEVARTGDVCKLLSAPTAFPFLQRLRGVKRLEKLSPAALETLAVIAYRQPVMRSEIEAIRGVKAGPMLRTLLQHKLVRVTGRADVPGRPLQYGTTQQFLERFGLSSLQELPSVKEFKQLG